MRRRAALGLLLLAAAAPHTPSHAPPHPAGPHAAKPPPPAKPEDLAEQLAMLAFDANPLWGIPARTVLSRWAGPLNLFMFGRKEDRADAAIALRALARPTGLHLRLVAEHEVARRQPNAFLVVDEDLPGALGGPLRPMLRNAFLDDEAAVEAFLAGVVAATPSWMLPVWTDSGRTLLKASVIGVDAKLPRAESRAAILHGLGAALGPMGPGAFLPGSAFVAFGPDRLSRDDERMLRLLYGRALHPGMSRAETHGAALKALTPKPRGPKAPHR